MRSQPGSLDPSLTAASASTDTAAPSAAIVSPATGTTVTPGTTVTIQGTATDAGGGRVGGVEVSLDGGTSWHPASGRESWRYTWTPSAAGQVTLMARAADDSANLGSATSASIRVGGSRSCPCSLFGDLAPTQATDENQAIEVGVRFRADVDGFVTGLRYYGAASSAPRVGHLWTEGGTQLASATFVGDSLVGWHTVALSPAVRVTKDTTYVASFLSSDGTYYADPGFFNAAVRRGAAARAGRHQRRLQVRRRLPHRQLRRHELRRRRPLHADRPDAAAGRGGRSRPAARRASTRAPRSPSPSTRASTPRPPTRPPSPCATKRERSSPPTSPTTRRPAPPPCSPGRRWPGRPRTPPRPRAAPPASPTSPATRWPRTARGRSPPRRRRPASTAPARSAPRARSAGSGSSQHGSTSSAAKRLLRLAAHRPGVEERDGQAPRHVPRGHAQLPRPAQAPGRQAHRRDQDGDGGRRQDEDVSRSAQPRRPERPEAQAVAARHRRRLRQRRHRSRPHPAALTQTPLTATRSHTSHDTDRHPEHAPADHRGRPRARRAAPRRPRGARAVQP